MKWFRKKTPDVFAPEQPAEDVATVEADGEWISVREQIPEFGVRVLVADTEYGVLTGHRSSQNKDGNYWTLGCRSTNPYSMYYHEATSSHVTHWMPMPAPPTRTKAAKKR